MSLASFARSLLFAPLAVGVWLRGQPTNLTDEASPLTADAAGLSDDAASQSCMFELYDPINDVLRPVDLGPSSVVFDQGNVVVVDGAPGNDGTFQRYFTFKQAPSKEASSFGKFFQSNGVASLARSKCREQVQVTCGAAQASDAASSCVTRPCVADAGSSDIHYLRALIGSTLAHRDHLDRVVVLGAGAGIIPYAVLQRFPGAVVDAVDLSGDVLAAAPCFGLQESDHVKLVEADGRSYLEGLPDGSVDLLFLDVYDDHAKIPSCFTTSEFFKMARGKLTSNGTFAMNLVTSEQANVLPATLAAFKDVRVGTLTGDDGNHILLAYAGGPAAADAPDSSEPAGDDNKLASTFAAWSREPAFTAAQSSSEARSDAQWCN